MPAVISVEGYPNQIVAQVASGDTAFHKIAVPNGVPTGTLGTKVIIKCLDESGVLDGSMILVNFNQTSAPSIGFPVSGSGQALSITFNQNLWIALTVATDIICLLFYY